MNDLEMVKKCAEKMGLDALTIEQSLFDYNPLHDDAQAMALVKKFRLSIGPDDDSVKWCVWDNEDSSIEQIWGDDLNRAIVECIAAMP